MPDTLTTTGLSIDDLETRRAAVVADLRADISSLLDPNPAQPTGQLVDILLERVQATFELLQLLYASFDPEQASGRSLDAVSSITGTYRDPATYGSVTLRLNLNAATTVPAGSIAAVAGAPDNQWVTTAAVTSVGAGNYDVAARASETGPIQALINTITVIVTPVAGWNSVNNPLAAAVQGENIETDAALRARRIVEVTIGGSTSVDAIRAAVSTIDNILEVFCYENDLDVTVAPMPPHSIEVVYWDGGAAAASVADIREAIFEEKPAGIQAYGSAYAAHTDDQGNDHQIGLTLADEQRIIVVFTATYDSDFVGGSLQDACEAYSDNFLGIGDDVYRAELIAVGMAVTGVVNITQVDLAISPAVPANVDIVITDRQIATIDNLDVTE
jgi:hypothetical protein